MKKQKKRIFWSIDNLENKLRKRILISTVIPQEKILSHGSIQTLSFQIHFTRFVRHAHIAFPYLTAPPLTHPLYPSTIPPFPPSPPQSPPSRLSQRGYFRTPPYSPLPSPYPSWSPQRKFISFPRLTTILPHRTLLFPHLYPYFRTTQFTKSCNYGIPN